MPRLLKTGQLDSHICCGSLEHHDVRARVGYRAHGLQELSFKPVGPAFNFQPQAGEELGDQIKIGNGHAYVLKADYSWHRTRLALNRRWASAYVLGGRRTRTQLSFGYLQTSLPPEKGRPPPWLPVPAALGSPPEPATASNFQQPSRSARRWRH